VTAVALVYGSSIPEGELAGEDIQWLAQKLSYYIRYFLSWPAWLKVFIIFMTGAAILKIINFHEERAKDRIFRKKRKKKASRLR